MSEQSIMYVAWAGLVLLAILCLPMNSVRKFVLSLTSWALRLSLLAVLGGGAYLYFRPAEMPAEVANTVAASPELVRLLPDPAASYFSLCLACLIAAPLVPIMAALDVARILAGRRTARLAAIADGHPVVMSAATPPREPTRAAVVEQPVYAPPPETTRIVTPVSRPIDRRTASTTITTARYNLPVAPVGR
ncbi:MAG TPA: hypothetical protein VHR66_23510 [Gemmataceae bacterium]|jgi:hypothetical protein|nr:hypothetical protein [Gemmataceae bacterium]